ncbi:MAG: hypothetical protein WC241_02215 [Candidatus Paceibacterota bacterium]|jgi:hypothetical protein
MKKFFWGLLFCILVIGCKTGPLEPDPIPVITYTVTAETLGQIGSVSPTYTVVTKGDGVNFSFTLPLGFDPATVTVNGVQTPLTSTTYSFSPTIDTKLVFESKRNRFGLLIWKPWKGFLERKRSVGTVEWKKSPADNFIFSYIFGNEKFKKYNSLTVFDATTLEGEGPYILTDDSLFVGFNPQGLDGIRNKVDVLTADTLRIRSISKFFGNPKLPDTEIESTYIH